MTQVSAPVRVVALVGLLAALAMGAWMMTAGRAESDSGEAVEQLRPVRKADVVATRLSSRNNATAAGDTAPAAKPAVAAKRIVSTKPAPATKTTVPAKATEREAVAKPEPKLPKGTPTTIAGLLAQHSVVVVLLYDARSKVDGYSLDEAVLGARNADAGFLRVDVRNEKQARRFTNAYGVLQTPTLLVFRRPGTLALKLSGFADHETVEQAATSAAHLKIPTPTP